MKNIIIFFLISFNLFAICEPKIDEYFVRDEIYNGKCYSIFEVFDYWPDGEGECLVEKYLKFVEFDCSLLGVKK